MAKTLASIIREFQGNNDALVYLTGFRTFRWTYDELYFLVSKFVKFLEKNKLKKGDKLMIWGSNSPEWAVAFLGCVVKGVIVVPMDIRGNIGLVRKVYSLTKPKMIISTKFKKLPRNKAKVFLLENLFYDIEEFKPSKIKDYKVKETDLVEIVYTSGTTGKPKGVMLTHKNIFSNIKQLSEVFMFGKSDKFLSLLPLSHLFEQNVGFLIPLSSGSSIVYIRSIAPSSIREALAKENISTMVIVPRILKSFADGIRRKVAEKGKEKSFDSLLKFSSSLPFGFRKVLFKKIHDKFGLKFFIVGGAPLDSEIESFYDNMGLLLLQGYGLTETSPIIACNTPHERRLGSVGKVLPGQRIIFKDEELYVKGDNVTKGYYNDKKRTKKSFDKDFFKTNDAGYIDDEGFVFLKGRKDYVIITSEGLNVYPEDIEEKLNEMPRVKDSCVIGINGNVHAVLLLEKKGNLKKIVQDTNSKLADYQQIKSFSEWKQNDFPRTSTMKIKKNLVAKSLKIKIKKEKKARMNELYSLLSEISGAKRIKPYQLIYRDLKIGSMERLELVSLIQDRLGIELGEDVIGLKTKVKDLEKAVKEKKKFVSKIKFRHWINSWPVAFVRNIMQSLILFPFIRYFCKINKKGLHNIKDMKGPVIFTANHQSHFDFSVIMMSLPFRFRKNSIATRYEYFIKKGKMSFLMSLLYEFMSIFYNSYLFPQISGFTKSVQHTGELLDRGINITLFPEGERSRDGSMLPFKQGIGLIASELKAPIVPVKLEGLYEVLPRWNNWPKRGPVSVKFGAPLYFKNESYLEITKAIEKAIKSL